MIYFLYGDTTGEGSHAVQTVQTTLQTKASTLTAELLKKKPDASLFTLTDENWNEAAIDEYTGSQGLFEKKYIVLVRNILSGGGARGSARTKERKEMFLDKIELFAESPNIFIVAETNIDKATLTKIKKYAEKVQEIKTTESRVADTRTNVIKLFDLADAFGARDKKRLWQLYHQAILAGKVAEEIHGILFWQVKSMIVASRTKSASEAGLNPYVYSKSRRYAENYTGHRVEDSKHGEDGEEKDTLNDLLKKLISIYHDAHRGIHDFEIALEIFILSL